MRALDSAAIKGYGIKGLVLMENAGRAVADVVIEELERTGGNRVAVVAGKGNNGGDGFVAARHLKNSGIHCDVFCFGPLSALKGDAATNAAIWKKMQGGIYAVNNLKDLEKHALSLRHADVIVDAIFGTGLSTDVRGVHKSAIELVNRLAKTVISVDIASGIDASTGRVLGEAVRADVTVTFGLAKLGHFLYPGRELSGRIEVVDIGIPAAIVDDADIEWNLVDNALALSAFGQRQRNSHKGTFGHVLTVGGSVGKTGAPCMAAIAALKAGAGLSTIAAPKSVNAAVEAKVMEAMTSPVTNDKDGFISNDSAKDVLKALHGKDALVIGPGLGTVATYNFMEAVLEGCLAEGVSVVIDADGLNIIKANASALKKYSKNVPIVLTPHPGEMARLLDISADEVQADRLKAAGRLHDISGVTVVLKGAATVVRGKYGFFINPTGNSGLASAGTGDVLSGMIGALLARGVGATEAAAAAVYVHGLTADRIAAKRKTEYGITATDITRGIPQSIAGLSSGR